MTNRTRNGKFARQRRSQEISAPQALGMNLDATAILKYNVHYGAETDSNLTRDMAALAGRPTSSTLSFTLTGHRH